MQLSYPNHASWMFTDASSRKHTKLYNQEMTLKIKGTKGIKIPSKKRIPMIQNKMNEIRQKDWVETFQYVDNRRMSISLPNNNTDVSINITELYLKDISSFHSIHSSFSDPESVVSFHSHSSLLLDNIKDRIEDITIENTIENNLKNTYNSLNIHKTYQEISGNDKRINNNKILYNIKKHITEPEMFFEMDEF